MKAALLALCLCACAVGVATVNADGTCEVKGYAVGRAEISADKCKIHGGTGSSDFYDMLSAAVGAVIGWVAH